MKKSPSEKRGLIHSRQLEEPEVNALNVERNLAQGTSVQNLCNFRCWRNFWKYFKIKKKSTMVEEDESSEEELVLSECAPTGAMGKRTIILQGLI